MSPPIEATERHDCLRCGKHIVAGGVWRNARRTDYCSLFCSARPLDELDLALERAIVYLLRGLTPGTAMSLVEAVEHVGHADSDELTGRALEAGRRLEASGDVTLWPGASATASAAGDTWVQLAMPALSGPRSRKASGVRRRVSRVQNPTRVEPRADRAHPRESMDVG